MKVHGFLWLVVGGGLLGFARAQATASEGVVESALVSPEGLIGLAAFVFVMAICVFALFVTKRSRGQLRQYRIQEAQINAALVQSRDEITRLKEQFATLQAELKVSRTKEHHGEKALAEALAKNQALSDVIQDKEAQNESALVFLTLLQERGRLVDFLMEDVSGYTDQEVGSASRVVHGGCRKLLQECFTINPILQQPEGVKILVSSLQNPASKDLATKDPYQYYRLIGNVPDEPEASLEGKLIHRGWETTRINLPKRTTKTPFTPVTDRGVIVPAEIEI